MTRDPVHGGDVWQLTRKGLPDDAPPGAWRVVIREPFVNVAGRAVPKFTTVHDLGIVWNDGLYWCCRGPKGYRAGGFTYRSGAAGCLYDDWETTAATMEIVRRVRAVAS